MSVSRPISTLFFALGLIGIAGCSGDATDSDGDGIADGVVEPNNVTVIAPVRPTGYVAGEVREASSDRPLSGAAVKIFGPGVAGEAVTDASGTFQIGPIAAGVAFTVKITAMGKADAEFGAMIDDVSGDFPVANGGAFVGPISLVANDATATVQVVSDEGLVLEGAAVTIISPAYFYAGGPTGRAFASAETGANGLATVTGLPNMLAALPYYRYVGYEIFVDPLDIDDDGRADYAGAYLLHDVRETAGTPIVVLSRASRDHLEVIGSNIGSLVNPGTSDSSILAEGNGEIRVVYNKPIDRDSVLIDLRNEDGSDTILTAVVISGVDNVLTIDPAEDLDAGQEYNIAVRANSRDGAPTEVLSVAGAFLVADNRDSPIIPSGRFADLNGNLSWGDGNDAIIFSISTPIGRGAGASPAFYVDVWVSADLNNDGVVGNAMGELPSPGGAYPPPSVLAAAEPSPGNGANGSGYTRYIQPLGVNLLVPLGQASGAVGFEIRMSADRNDGRFVTTGSGRQAPIVFTASAPLVGR